MTAGSPAKPIKTEEFQQAKRRVLPMVLSALLATLAFTADTRAYASPSATLAANLDSAAPSRGATQKKWIKKEKSSSSKAGRRSCWQRVYKFGRWKRRNVCFTGDWVNSR